MSETVQIPKGWKLKKLGELEENGIIKDKKGKKPSNIFLEKTTDSLPYVNIKAFEKNIITGYGKKDDGVVCKKDDVLIVWDGSRSGLTGFGIEGLVGSTIVLLKCSKILLPKFLFYFIKSKYNKINSNPKGSSIPHVKPELFWNLTIPMIPISTQKQIITKLDHILGELEVKKKEIISIIEQNKERIDFFEKNFFSQIMKKYLQIDNVPETWTVKPLGDITTRIGGGTPKKNNDEYYQGDIPWFTITDLSNEITFPKIIHNSKMKITEKAIKESSAKKIPKNAVILGTRVGVGKLAIAGKEVTTNQDFSSFVCSKEIEPYFLGCYLLAIRQQLQQKSRGLTVKGIITSELDNLSIGYPSNEEQTKIIKNIKSAEEKFQSQKKQFENIKNNYESKIKYINHIQSSILDSAFSGKLIQ
jgi:type I restriction enzyme, S subunit